MNRVRAIFTTGSNDQKFRALRDLRVAIRQRNAPPLTPQEVGSACDAVDRPGGWGPEFPLSLVWALLLTVPAHDRLRELAHRQLVNQAAPHRGPAFTYLTSRYPAEAEFLLSQYRGDADPELLVAIGWYLEPRQDGSSVDAWVDALRYPMTRDVFDEALLAILNTAEERHVRRLKDVARHSPYRPQVLELTSEVKDRIRRRGSRG